MPRKLALIVDDSATAQHRLKTMLSDYDLEVKTVDSGEEALLFLDGAVPDVIFLDHQMPGMDGFRALQTIKSHPETAVIPVIMYTSKGGDVYTGQARALGALDVVSKDSFNATDLSRVLKMIHIVPAAGQVSPAASPGVGTVPPVPQKAAHEHIEPRSPQEKSPANSVSPDVMHALEVGLNKLELAHEDKLNAMAIRLVREIQALKLRDSRLESLERTARSTYQETLKHTPAPTSWHHRLALPVLVTACVIAVASVGYNRLHAELLGVRDGLASLQVQTNAIQKSRDAEAALRKKTPTTAASSPLLQENYLQDMAWSFNQVGMMEFGGDSVDPRILARLRELLSRMGNRGVSGALEVNVSIGDFCTVSAPQGQRAMPPEGAKLGDCILASKLYRMDRLQNAYSREIKALVKPDSKITLVVRPVSGAIAYPELSARTLAQDWNASARRNNRLEIRALPAASDEAPSDAPKP